MYNPPYLRCRKVETDAKFLVIAAIKEAFYFLVAFFTVKILHPWDSDPHAPKFINNCFKDSRCRGLAKPGAEFAVKFF